MKIIKENKKNMMRKESRKIKTRTRKKEEEEKLKQIKAKIVKQQSKYLLISCPCGSEFQKTE